MGTQRSRAQDPTINNEHFITSAKLMNKDWPEPARHPVLVGAFDTGIKKSRGQDHAVQGGLPSKAPLPGVGPASAEECCNPDRVILFIARADEGTNARED